VIEAVCSFVRIVTIRSRERSVGEGGFVWCRSCMGERLVGNCGRRNEFGKLGVGLTCWWRW
jgi:hypothetical protein